MTVWYIVGTGVVLLVILAGVALACAKRRPEKSDTEHRDIYPLW